MENSFDLFYKICFLFKGKVKKYVSGIFLKVKMLLENDENESFLVVCVSHYIL